MTIFLVFRIYCLDSDSWRETGEAGEREREREFDIQRRGWASFKPGQLQ